MAETQIIKVHKFIKCPGCRYEHLCTLHKICFHCGYEIKNEPKAS